MPAFDMKSLGQLGAVYSGGVQLSTWAETGYSTTPSVPVPVPSYPATATPQVPSTPMTTTGGSVPPLPPNPEPGTVERDAKGWPYIFRADSGNVYVYRVWGALGHWSDWKWLRCPVLPNMPSLPSNDIMLTVMRVREWTDAAISFVRSAYAGWEKCPSYKSMPEAERELERRVKTALAKPMGYQRFSQAVWDLMIPGCWREEGGHFYLSNPVGVIPPRGDDRRTAIRIETLGRLWGRLSDRVTTATRTDSVLGHIWSWEWDSWHPQRYEWIRDLGLSEAELERRYDGLAGIIRAMARIPWPHWFFASFMYAPSVEVPPFYMGFRFNDARLAETDYFPRSPEAIERDVATYIATNAGLLEKHFEIEVARWLAEQQARMEKRQEAVSMYGAVISAIASLITMGAGLVATAAITAAKVAVGAAMMRNLAENLKDRIEKIYTAIGTTLDRISRFKDWIAAKADMPPPQAGPNTPAGARGAYSVFVEDVFVGSGDDASALVELAWPRTTKWDRIIVKDEATGDVIAVVIHGEDDRPVVVPAPHIAAVLALTKDQIRDAAVGAGGMPWGILAAVAAGGALLLA